MPPFTGAYSRAGAAGPAVPISKLPVEESHRGRGIAQALKVRGIMWAKIQSMPIIRTDNDSLNAPMLAVNRKLGYRPEVGFYKLVQPVANNRAATASEDADLVPAG